MADSCIFREEEEDEFFDSREDISSVYDSCPGSPGHHDSCPTENFNSCFSGDFRYPFWSGRLSSVRVRRYSFMKWLGSDLIGDYCPDSLDSDGEVKMDDENTADIDRIMSDGGAVMRVFDEENESSMPCCSNEPCAPSDRASVENIEYKITNFDDGIVSIVDELGNDGSLRSIHKARSNRIVTIDEFERGFSPSIQNLSLRKDNTSNNSDKIVRRRKKIGWLRRLGVAACIVGGHGEESDLSLSDSDCSGSVSVRRVRVRPYKKRFKEFSAVYMGQNIKAHDGAILTMKFSPDGQYLATGGDDRVVCVWCVMEYVRTNESDVPMDDPSCIYFMMNHNSELVPLYKDKEKKDKSRSMRTSDSTCVIIPADTFQLSEKPLHIFRGHDGDVLDLSWSKNKYLLSSSTDKTVRMWRVGCDICLKVFSHNNYVTCIQFNPVDEKYFISGSIDGKVRIWEIPGCQVVDWIDVKEIVTAVCYCPDGKGGVVGFMSGDCHFYDLTDNHLQLDAQISLQGKKKSPCKRITSFQFSPTDHRKLMVTSADSQIRILDGVEVISKYRGSRSAGSQLSASFTSDGRHIISASEDSYVYLWSHDNPNPPTCKQVKSTQSCERFFSTNASVAIPWHGLDTRNSAPVDDEIPLSHSDYKSRVELSGSKHSGSSILGHDFFSELLPKGSATWPEEKLPDTASICKSHYKFLKTCCQNTPHAWGQVIVTAGWDGRIRSFRNYGLPVHV